MSHASRHFPGGMVYHVLNRGVSRRTLFEKDQDFLAFETVVEEALRTCRMRTWLAIPNYSDTLDLVDATFSSPVR